MRGQIQIRLECIITNPLLSHQKRPFPATHEATYPKADEQREPRSRVDASDYCGWPNTYRRVGAEAGEDGREATKGKEIEKCGKLEELLITANMFAVRYFGRFHLRIMDFGLGNRTWLSKVGRDRASVRSL